MATINKAYPTWKIMLVFLMSAAIVGGIVGGVPSGMLVLERIEQVTKLSELDIQELFEIVIGFPVGIALAAMILYDIPMKKRLLICSMTAASIVGHSQIAHAEQVQVVQNNFLSGESSMSQSELVSLVNANDIEGMKKALANGAEVNTYDENKRSLLLLATHHQYSEMVELLTINGADVNQQDVIQDSAFLYAGARGYTAYLTLFLAHGARFDVFNRYHGTALIPASERAHVDTVALLANTQGFPINHVNRLGWTALMEAVVLGNGSAKYQEVVKILLDAGADKSIPDKEGITALQHAQRMGQAEVAKLLAE